jgi:transposase
MPSIDQSARSAVHAELTLPLDGEATLFVALELSLSSWVVVASAPGESNTSKHSIAACDGAGLLSLLKRLQARAEQRCRRSVSVVVMQEAGRDGFWVHRLLESNGVCSQVVDPASIAVNRRSRRAKTDRIDAEAMLRTLMAWGRGERQVCAMVRAPTREAEDIRRLSREREALLSERIRHANRIKGLLATQGVFSFEPTLRDRHDRLDAIHTPDGTPLPPRLRTEILRQLDRLELTLQQLAAVEAERDAVLAAERAVAASVTRGSDSKAAEGQATPGAPVPGPEGAGARLLRLKGVGPETASVLASELFFRAFTNRREVASYAGLAPSPWQSGGIDNEQGISKAGNARVRKTMGQLAWLWLRHQPDSALSLWYRERVRDGRGRVKRIAIVALARKLLVALWRFVTQGLVPTGATLKIATTS